MTMGIMRTVREGDVLVLQDGTEFRVRLIKEGKNEMFPYTVWNEVKSYPFDHYDYDGRSENGPDWNVIGVMKKRDSAGAVNQDDRATAPGGTKHDQGKPDLSLIPSDVLWEVAEVLTHGAAVYGKYNWTKGFDYTRLQAAVLRHINQWARGIEKDVDSGKSHLTHALCGLMMLRAMEIRGLGNDDRDRTGYEKQI